MKKILLILVGIWFCNKIIAQDVVHEYNVPSAEQAVAVDSKHFYVINNKSITKHKIEHGFLVDTWEDKDSLVKHMNSGIIIKGKLYCINSNYPEIPMTSSLEVFDAKTLEHIENHSFGILNGSATWIDYYKKHWYVAFAHYSGKNGVKGKDNSWTRLVKFDRKWRQIESWVLPKSLIKKFGAKSNSGGVILSDGRILISGHDNFEIYQLEFPVRGSTLNWVKTIKVGSFGQGFAFKKEGAEEFIYGIIRKDNIIVKTRIE